MTKQELLDYFKVVLELENQIYTYDRIKASYENKIAALSVPQKLSFTVKNGIPVISGERLEETEKPEWNETKEYKDIINQKLGNPLRNRVVAIIVTILIFGMIIFCLAKFVFGMNNIFDLLLLGIIPFCIVIGVVLHNFPVYDPSNIIKSQVSWYYSKCVEEEALVVAKSEKPLIFHLEYERDELVIQPRNNVKALLDKVYSIDVIFPKYRCFAAVAQIYEYLLSGRCERLEGPDGAYNLYESELRQNIIIDRLDEIASQLRILNRTMHTICGMLNTTNGILSSISSTLGRIETNTALTAYNTQCIAYNTKVSNQYVV